MTVSGDNKTATVTSQGIGSTDITITGNTKVEPVAPVVTNNVAHTTVEVSGDTVTLTCQEGYIFDGTPTVTIGNDPFTEPIQMTVADGNKTATLTNDGVGSNDLTIEGNTKTEPVAPVITAFFIISLFYQRNVHVLSQLISVKERSKILKRRTDKRSVGETFSAALRLPNLLGICINFAEYTTLLCKNLINNPFHLIIIMSRIIRNSKGMGNFFKFREGQISRLGTYTNLSMLTENICLSKSY